MSNTPSHTPTSLPLHLPLLTRPNLSSSSTPPQPSMSISKSSISAIRSTFLFRGLLSVSPSTSAKDPPSLLRFWPSWRCCRRRDIDRSCASEKGATSSILCIKFLHSFYHQAFKNIPSPESTTTRRRPFNIDFFCAFSASEVLVSSSASPFFRCCARSDMSGPGSESLSRSMMAGVLGSPDKRLMWASFAVALRNSVVVGRFLFFGRRLGRV